MVFFQLNGLAATDLRAAKKIAEKKKVRIGINEESRRKCNSTLLNRESTGGETLARVWSRQRKKYIAAIDGYGLGWA